MNRVLTASLTALCIAGLCISPVMADDAKDGGKDGKDAKPAKEPKAPKAAKEPKAPKEEAKPEKLGSKSSGGGGDAGLGGRLIGFPAGVLVGVPVAIVRRTGIEIKQGVKDLVGDTDNWFIIGPAGVLAVPYGGVSGGIGGVLYGVKNAWVGAGDEPFGKDSFSLGDNVD